jgi:predicted hotdog family 3-hydroxylacyl-ACP dehydratase
MKELTGWQQLLPHAGRMCLLERVIQVTDHTIECSAISHRDPLHPLACAGRLPIHCGLEYAAQAAGIHGGWCEQQRGASPRVGGMLAACKFARWYEPWLHSWPGALHVRAQRMAATAVAWSYKTCIFHRERPLLEAELVIALLPMGAN